MHLKCAEVHTHFTMTYDADIGVGHRRQSKASYLLLNKVPKVTLPLPAPETLSSPPDHIIIIIIIIIMMSDNKEKTDQN